MGRNDIRRGKSDTARRRIAVLAYPGAQRAAIHGLIDLFETASRLAATDTKRRTMLMATQWNADDCRGRRGAGLAAIIVPPSLGGTIGVADAAPIAAWLRARHREGTVVCSVCAGAFLLAESGLLDGRAATTHWALAAEFAARFPDVRLAAERMLIDDGDVLTAGGVMAWTDLGLRLIERWLSPAVMLETARMFLIDPAGREQRHYAPYSPATTHGDAAVRAAQTWLAAHHAGAVSIAQLADAAGVGERTLLRRFKSATGETPTAYLQRLRVGRARELLEQTGDAFEDVAWAVGYADAGALRKIFQRVVGITPGEYRRRFRPRAGVDVGATRWKPL
ncbi:MAG TPA: helix-turn-helix domain-containing protein [Solimonas sp.]|nr:helix-turn-helix domain-containing protein [Solimonas sp.]